MSAHARRKVYRLPLLQKALTMAILLLGFALLGLGPLLAGLSEHDGGMVVYGAVVLLLCLLIGAVLGNIARLVVTPDYVEYRYALSSKVVPWAEVESFDVGSTPGSKYIVHIPYPTLVIHLTDGSEVVTRMAGYTAKYPTHLVNELTAYQRQLAPAPHGWP